MRSTKLKYKLKRLNYNNIQSSTHFGLVLLLTIFLYLIKNIFWPLTILFIICYILSLVLFIYQGGLQINFKPFIRDFFLPLILLIILVVVYLTNKDYKDEFLFKETMRPLVLFSLFFMGYDQARKGGREILKYKPELIYLITISIISFLNLLHNVNPAFFSNNIFRTLNISTDLSISQDSNLLCLFTIFGFILLFNDNSSLRFKLKYNFLVTSLLTTAFIINIFLSASRRGLIIFALVFLIQSIATLSYFIKNNKSVFLLRKAGSIIIVLVIFSLVGYSILNLVPKDRITLAVTRYASFKGINDYKYIERLLWERKLKEIKRSKIIIRPESFSLNPEYWQQNENPGNIIITDTPYGKGFILTRNHTEDAFPFFYNGPKIIYYANHTYLISFKVKFIKGDKASFSLGWYVNDGGRGYKTQRINRAFSSLGDGWFECQASYTFIENHAGINGFITHVGANSEFIITDFSLIDKDFNKKMPQYVAELRTKSNMIEYLNSINKPLDNNNSLINNGDFEYGLKFWTCNADSTNLEIIKTDSINYCHIARGDGDGVNWSLIYIGRSIIFYSDNEYLMQFKLKLIDPQSRIPFNIGYWVNEGKGYLIDLEPEIDTLSGKWLDIKVKYDFKYDQDNIGFGINSQEDYSEFYITDITLKNLTKDQNYQINTEEKKQINKRNVFFGDRSSRWRYAQKIWKNEYSVKEKIIGKSYRFVNLFSSKFTQGKRVDYPHNPFISILLYSGAIGLIIYVIFIIQVILIYYKYRNRYSMLPLMFIATYIFSFFSGINPFDPPIMGFFVLLPFLFKYLPNNTVSQ